MKTSLLSAITLIYLLPACTCSFAQLEIKIENLVKKESKIFIAIYDSESNFPGDSMIYSKVVEAQTEMKEVTINDLPSGKYAIAVFQDLNGNGKMDKKLFGIPMEPYGFSGTNTQRKAPPEFEEASFIFNDKLSIKIHLK